VEKLQYFFSLGKTLTFREGKEHFGGGIIGGRLAYLIAV
jgi:hypothetical protein